jgi:4'-phosphopantetheinyl transferase
VQAPPSASWTDAPERLQLGVDEVHVWRATLDVSPERLPELRQLLSDDERRRADRLARDTHRRFIAARGLLRTILGRYLAIRPDTLRFAYGEHGKPRLADDTRTDALEFTLAHSGDLVLYAVASGRQVGIDVERVRNEVNPDRIAERFFSAGEIAAIRAAPEGSRLRLFFRQWTRKEAYVKALGIRMWDALDTDPAAPTDTSSPARVTSPDLSLREIEVGPGHVATLAIEGTEPMLRCWQLRA